MTYDVGNPGPSWDRYKSVTVLNQLMDFQKPPLLVLINLSPMVIHILTNNKKPAQIYFHSKRLQTITKMKDKINVDSTITGIMNAQINVDSTIAGIMNAQINVDSTITGIMNAQINVDSTIAGIMNAHS